MSIFSRVKCEYCGGKFFFASSLENHECPRRAFQRRLEQMKKMEQNRKEMEKRRHLAAQNVPPRSHVPPKAAPKYDLNTQSTRPVQDDGLSNLMTGVIIGSVLADDTPARASSACDDSSNSSSYDSSSSYSSSSSYDSGSSSSCDSGSSY